MRFLIDECLSVELTLDAERIGYEAHHLVHIGKSSWKDWNIVTYATDGDFTFVTNNAKDFRKLYAKQSIHAGLVILLPSVELPLQRRLFRVGLNHLAERGELINRVLEIGFEGDEVIFDSYDLPSGKVDSLP